MENNPTPEHQAILATTLFNFGKEAEALASIKKAVEADPNNQEYRRLQDIMLKHNGAYKATSDQ